MMPKERPCSFLSLMRVVRRLWDHREADRHYSGKRKAHTIKTQVVVTLGNGDVRGGAPGEPGPGTDPTLPRPSGVLARVTPGDSLTGGQAYRAVDNVVTPRHKLRGKERPRRMWPSIEPSPARIVAAHSIRDLRQFQALTLPDWHRRRGQEPRVCAVVELRMPLPSGSP